MKKKAEQLKKLDTFYAVYGFSVGKFIVSEVNENGVIVTMPDWLKSDFIFLPFSRLNQDISFMIYKPYSKLRWFLKF